MLLKSILTEALSVNTNLDAEGNTLNILVTVLSTLMIARMKTAFFGGHIARWLKNLIKMPSLS